MTAFWGCTGLTSITIPEKVDSIGNRAFGLCEKLTKIYCHPEIVPRTHPEAFWGVPVASATLYVPASAIDMYKATEPWSNFGSIVPLTTPIDNVLCDESSTRQSYYDLQGRQINSLPSGRSAGGHINIIRNSDGTSKKFLIK